MYFHIIIESFQQLLQKKYLCTIIGIWEIYINHSKWLMKQFKNRSLGYYIFYVWFTGKVKMKTCLGLFEITIGLRSQCIYSIRKLCSTGDLYEYHNASYKQHLLNSHKKRHYGSKKFYAPKFIRFTGTCQCECLFWIDWLKNFN